MGHSGAWHSVAGATGTPRLGYQGVRLPSVANNSKEGEMEYKPISIEGCFDETLVISSTSIPYGQRYQGTGETTRQQQIECVRSGRVGGVKQ